VGWLAEIPEVIRRSSPGLTRPSHVQDTLSCRPSWLSDVDDRARQQ
jgi:hypothetical protein